jgi:arylsulfatase A-like enzyme
MKPSYTLPAALLLALSAGSGLPAAEAERARPNIIFILVDDQGYYDLGCYGASEFRTPHIDGLAAAGVRFTDYYAAAPICSPSRAGLLTGCYPRRVGLATWVQRADSRIGLHPDELTLAELLRGSGYATACIGKWHLGFHEPFLPQQQGFEHYFGLLHNLDPVEVVYFADQGGVPLLRGIDVVQRPADPAQLTRQYTDEAITWIETHRERPFFLYLPHTMLHEPLGVSPPFRGSSQFGEYGDAIQELDHHVGRLLAALERLEIDDRTAVVYASDNGRGPGRNADQPLRGSKLSTYEAGIRVPCIAWGAGVRSGHVSAEVVRAMDWYPTLATLAGVPVPPGRVIDGRDLSPLLSGRSDAVPPPGTGDALNAGVPLRRPWNPPGEWEDVITREEYHNAFFYHGSHGALAAVRWDRWKLFLNPTLQLYDLQQDPGETQPIRNGQIARKLRGMAILFQDEMRTGTRPAGEVDASSSKSGEEDEPAPCPNASGNVTTRASSHDEVCSP